MKKLLLTITMLISLTVLFFALGTTASAWSHGDLSYTVSAGEVTITNCAKTATEVEIPSEIDGYPVTAIGYQAFYGCSSLTSVTVPDSVTSIGEGAFRKCTSLESMTLPFVGSNASANETNDAVFGYIFDYTSSSSSGTVRQNYSFYYNDYFYYYIPSSLRTVKITNDTDIPYGAFYNCSMLTSIELPDTITSIDSSAFYNCSGLTSITIPDSVTSIGEKIFYGCTSLTSITIPDSVTSIGGCAFYGCTSLTSITIPDTVTSIGSYAFYNTGYYNDESNWEDNVLYIENYLIVADYMIEKCIIKDGITVIADYAFWECRQLYNVLIPDSVKIIGGGAFIYCTNLGYISIPESVTRIGGDAFLFSSLTKIIIPASIEYLTDFDFCDNLVIIYGGTEEEWNALDVYVEDDAIIRCNHKEHLYENTRSTPPTCTESGRNVYRCICDDSYTEEIPATGHIEEIIPGTPATCTGDGVTISKKCSVCNQMLVYPSVIPAKGHTPGSWEVVKAAEIGKNGLEQQKCTDCGVVLNVRDIPALKNEGIAGDVDGNGKITAADARLALRISAKLEKATELQTTVADMDKNGKITAADARKILRISAKLETI